MLRSKALQEHADFPSTDAPMARALSQGVLRAGCSQVCSGPSCCQGIHRLCGDRRRSPPRNSKYVEWSSAALPRLHHDIELSFMVTSIASIPPIGIDDDCGCSTSSCRPSRAANRPREPGDAATPSSRPDRDREAGKMLLPAACDASVSDFEETTPGS